ncbi:MAG: type III pantothenate kinase [Planctomycetes bacterium]|nr:type III pantothenate kinase [Planctomycetota bacterium]
MIYRPRPFDPSAPVIVIDVGNTSIKVATWHEDQVKSPLSCPSDDEAAFEESYAAQIHDGPADTPVATVIASVVPDTLERLQSYLAATQDHDALVIGDGIPLPLDVDVDDASAIGADRVCAAAAAYETLQKGCTIVDFGTAVTVDLVNDEGTLIGGAILPGLAMQLRSLHEYTAALPEVDPAVPELPYGRNTIEAMQTGVCRGVVGAVRGLIEAYSTHLKHWSHVVATGGDAELLLPYCDFVDTAVHDLALRGVGVAYSKYLATMGA